MEVQVLFWKFLCCEKGTTAIEYGAIGVLISVGIIGSVTALGQSSELQLNNIADHMPK
ncbi:MAG: Flp family type IVb pilin [Nitratireductor sp.]|nr:Flp family type IVb pilin [Nitratireductor sp.]MCB1455166.1 Flp family type IVb pilin [Nitratireductor sp.]MCB1457841.1 Flp family type IVb pilin [Nitratireductor sp.]